MTTYIDDKERMFLKKNKNSLYMRRKRSHGRLKAYASAVDLRSWTSDGEAQRRHMLELVENAGTGYGNYIPILPLIDALGLKDSILLLNETIVKLTAIQEILTDGRGRGKLTESEMSLKKMAIRQGVDPDELNDEVVRNLRALVKDLVEQNAMFSDVRRENDSLKSTLSEQSQMMGRQLDELTYERNVFKAKADRIDEVLDKMKEIKLKYDATKAELKSLKKWVPQSSQELKNLQEKAAVVDKLEAEKRETRVKLHHLNKANEEREDLLKENLWLKATIGDQEDQINSLVEQIAHLVGKPPDLDEDETDVDYKAKSEKLEDDLKMATERIDYLETRLEAVTLELETAERDLQGYDSLQRRAVEVESALKAADNKIEELENSVADMNNLKKELEKCLEEKDECCARATEMEEHAFKLQGEIDNFKFKVNELKGDVQDYKKAKQRTKEDMETLKRNLSEAEKSLQKKETEIERLREENMELQKLTALPEEVERLSVALAEAKELLNNRKEKMAEVSQNLESKGKELEERTNILAKLKVRLDEAEKENKRMKDVENQNAKFKDEVDRVKKALMAAQESQLKANIAKQGVEAENSGLKFTMGELNKKLLDMKSKLKELQDQLCEEREALTNLEILRDEEADELRKRREDNTELEQKLSIFTQKLKDAEDLRKMTGEEYKAVKDQVQDMDNIKKELEDKLFETVNALDALNEKLAAFEKRENAYKTQLEEAESEKGKWEEQQKVWADEKENLGKAKEALERELRGLKEEKTVLQNNREFLDKNLEEARREIMALRNTLYDNRFETEELARTKAELEEKLGKLEGQIQTAEANLNLTKNEMVIAQRELQEANSKTEALTKELRQCQETNKKLVAMTSDFQMVKKELTATMGKLVETKEDRDELKRKNDKLQSDLEQLDNDLDNYKKWNNGLSLKNEELTNELEEVQKSLTDKLEESEKAAEAVGLALKKQGELEVELKNAKATKEQNEDEIKKLKREVYKEKNNVKRAEDVVAKLQSEVNGLQTVNDELRREAERSREEVAAKEKSNKALLSLGENAQMFKNKNKELTRAIEELTLEKEKTEKALELEKALHAELQGKLKKLEAKSVLDEDRLAEMTKEITALNEKLARASHRMREADEQEKKIKGELQLSSGRVKELEKAVEKSTGDLAAESKKRDETGKKIEELTGKIEELQMALDEVRGQNVKLRNSLNEAQTRLGDALAAKKEKNEELQETRKNLNSEKVKTATLESQIKGLNDEVAAQKKKVTELEKELEESKKSLKDANRKIDQISGEMRNLIQENCESAGKVAGMDKQRREADEANRKKVEELESRLAAAAERNEKLENERDAVKLGEDAVRRQLDGLAKEKEKLYTLKAEIDKLSNELDSEKEGNAALKEQLAGSQGDIKRKQKEIQDLNQAVDAMQDKMRESAAAVNSANEELANALMEIDLLKDNLNYIQQEKSNNMKEYDRLAAALAAEQKKFKDMKAEYETCLQDRRFLTRNHLKEMGELKVQMDELRAVLDEITGERDEFKSDLEKELEQNKKAQSELAKVKRNLEDLTGRVAELDSQVETYRDALNDAKNQMETMNREKEDLQERLSEAESFIQELQMDIVHHVDEFNTMDRNMKKLLHEIDLNRKEIAELTKRIEEERSKVIAAHDKIKNLENEVMDLKKGKMEADTDLDVVNKVQKDLENEISALKTDMARRDGELKELRGAKDELQASDKIKEEEIKVLKDRIAANEGDIANLNGVVKKMRASIPKLTKQKDAAETEALALKNNLDNLKKENEELKKKMDELKKVGDDLQKSLNETELMNASQDETINHLKDQLKLISGFKDAAENRLISQMEKMDQLKEERDAAVLAARDSQAEIVNLQIKLKTEEQAANQISHQMSELKRELGLSRTKMEQLEDELVDLKMERDELEDEVAKLKTELRKSEGPEQRLSPLIRILQKIIDEGIARCTLEELGEVHNAVTRATNNLIAEEKAALSPRAPVCKLDPSIDALSDEKKAILKKTCILQNEVAKRQMETQRRTCALTQSIQQYQKELESLRVWNTDAEIQKTIQDPQIQALKAQAELTQSQICHCLSMAETEKQRSVELETKLQNAMETMRSIQKSVLVPERRTKESEAQNRIIEALRGELKKAVVTERLLAKLLQEEKEKSAAYAFHVKLADENEKKRNSLTEPKIPQDPMASLDPSLVL